MLGTENCFQFNSTDVHKPVVCCVVLAEKTENGFCTPLEFIREKDDEEEEDENDSDDDTDKEDEDNENDDYMKFSDRMNAIVKFAVNKTTRAGATNMLELSDGADLSVSRRAAVKVPVTVQVSGTVFINLFAVPCTPEGR